MSAPLVVIDTDVVVTALIGSEATSSCRLMRAVGTGEVAVALSDAFLIELVGTIRNRHRQSIITDAARAFEIALDLGWHGEMHRPQRLDWTSVPDLEDYWMPDLAWSAEAEFIVTWDRHLLDAELPFPISVLQPPALLARLR